MILSCRRSSREVLNNSPRELNKTIYYKLNYAFQPGFYFIEINNLYLNQYNCSNDLMKETLK